MMDRFDAEKLATIPEAKREKLWEEISECIASLDENTYQYSIILKSIVQNTMPIDSDMFNDWLIEVNSKYDDIQRAHLNIDEWKIKVEEAVKSPRVRR